jgi:hypothetical protein
MIVSQERKESEVIYTTDPFRGGESVAPFLLFIVGIGIALIVVGFVAVAILVLPLLASALVALPSYLMYHYWYRIGKDGSRDEAIWIAQNLLQDGRVEEAYFLLLSNKDDKESAELLKKAKTSKPEDIILMFRLRGFILTIGILGIISTFMPFMIVGGTLSIVILIRSIVEMFRLVEIKKAIAEALNNNPSDNLAYANSLIQHRQIHYARNILYVTYSDDAKNFLQTMSKPSNYRYSEWYTITVTTILTILIFAAVIVTINLTRIQ